MDLNDEIGDVRHAVVAAAAVIEAREQDGSFLEATLRDRLAEKLTDARPEDRLSIDGWGGRLGGVDVTYRSRRAPSRLGVETKVWDVGDSLFDVLKLVAATRQGLLSAGFIVAAGRPTDWSTPSITGDMASGSRDHPAAWVTADVLASRRSAWPRIWSRSTARPAVVPAAFQTLTTAPVPMPRVPQHEIRIIAVQATGTERVAIGDDGQVSGPWSGRAN